MVHAAVSTANRSSRKFLAFVGNLEMHWISSANFSISAALISRSSVTVTTSASKLTIFMLFERIRSFTLERSSLYLVVTASRSFVITRARPKPALTFSRTIAKFLCTWSLSIRLVAVDKLAISWRSFNSIIFTPAASNWTFCTSTTSFIVATSFQLTFNASTSESTPRYYDFNLVCTAPSSFNPAVAKTTCWRKC